MMYKRSFWLVRRRVSTSLRGSGDAFVPIESRPTEWNDWMADARRVAENALQTGDVPVGALVVGPLGERLAEGWNTRERDADPCGHAEIQALRAAAQRLGSWRLEGCTVVVTLEPCAMCAGAMVLARIKRCVYGASDPKGGFLGSLGNLGEDARLNHRFLVVGGIEAEACAAQLRAFFRSLRRASKAARG